MPKLCGKCNKVKEEILFSKNKNKSDGLQTHCKECMSKYSKAYYRKDRSKRVKANRENRAIRRKYLFEYKSNHPCVLCNFDDPRCLDFHHRESEDKDTELSTAVARCWSFDRINAEIAKCDVVCSNCHRIIHWED